MRLLNTEDIIVESFPSPAQPEIPDYVILSHRWRDKEVSFQDIEHRKAGDGTEELERLEGADKILRCCKEARNMGFKYVWIDTCCINKTDQVELTQALNSMFVWYRQAQVCYAYLSDVPSDEDPLKEGSKFRQSKWFTRGWTLQELVAPQYVIFFAGDWKEIGTKSSFQELIIEVTGIPEQVLLTNSAGEISVAQRMSWAAKRKTSVVEDQAYCLLGLFNVKMQMTYGEGREAFRRLQLEIMKVSDDHTIFAWAGKRHPPKGGLLATSPRDFAHCRNVRRLGESPAFSMTNKGIIMKLPLIPQGQNVFLGILSCQRKRAAHYQDRYPLGIYLERVGGEGSTSYVRVRPEEMEEITEDVSSYEETEICVRETDPTTLDILSWMQPEPKYLLLFTIKQREHALPNIEYVGVDTGSFWVVNNEEISLTFHGSGCNSILIFKSTDHRIFAISLGVHNYNVWGAMTISTDADIKRIAREYWDGSMKDARWYNMDRRKLPLGEGDVATLAIRKGRKDGGRVYRIDIDAGENFWLETVGPGNFPGWWDPEKNKQT
ncbi:uncharacterized protein PV07_05701 [Cladophialophora immunda]|uniref:Heterokaryon incompatibility domain-containing protein n=1 Tax=Cladophialophora immunda TaxID=569365 RepID=A0A0D1ZPK0_9EURO|nr:uncharacterized protein PV07_05701 [Cladophialophora immunda]KIW29916.1 hypothetical protein PV07_05701 [Cladophialophora immunda]